MAQIQIILGTMTFGEQVQREAARNMIETFLAAGNRHVDTAYIYCDGATEMMLGELITPARRKGIYLATKAHPTEEEGMSAAAVTQQLNTSLSRLNTDWVDLFYLHSPHPETPIAATLRACHELYSAGKFRHLGLSNYAAWQVAEIAEMCNREGWMAPIVYQGMYNALTRDVERELFPCLRHYGIGFYAYNPLAGGLLSGKHPAFGEVPTDGRFSLHENYRDRYWGEQYFSAIGDLKSVCARHEVSPTAAALRWLVHHSCMSADNEDGVILGASRIEHLEHNMNVVLDGPLSHEVVEVLDRGWEATRSTCIKYFRP